MKIDLKKLFAGNRRTLAQAITLVESSATADRKVAKQLIGACLPRSGKSVRLGISGPPGVGKSTFINAFGMHLVDLGYKLAVLAIDPSSPTGGGSILGDKVRMPRLASAPTAYVRPTPSGGQLGGVTGRTRDCIVLCEAANFDFIIVETVGAGQSEVSVTRMVDYFAVLLQPASGDEIQGIKRGILDLIDMAIVNKADGELAVAAERTAGLYQSAFSLTRRNSFEPHVLQCSSLNATGIAEIWRSMQAEIDTRKAAGQFESKRSQQLVDAMEDEFQTILVTELTRGVRFESLRRMLRTKVSAGELESSVAAQTLANQILDGLNVVQTATNSDI